jgi:hypothetical protein
MNDRGIHVEAHQGARQTHIEVRGWPRDRHAYWSVYTSDHWPAGIARGAWSSESEDDLDRQLARGAKSTTAERRAKGRILTAIGRLGLGAPAPVAQLALHFEEKGSLTVMRTSVHPNLIQSEGREARVALLACALEVSEEMYEVLRKGDGCLAWRVQRRLADTVQRQYPGFNRRRKRPLRGDVILRNCR